MHNKTWWRWLVRASWIYIYGFCAVMNYGALNANNQYSCHHWRSSICDLRIVKRDQALAVFFSIVPPLWIATALITAGWEDGFSWSATPHVQQ